MVYLKSLDEFPKSFSNKKKKEERNPENVQTENPCYFKHIFVQPNYHSETPQM